METITLLFGEGKDLNVLQMCLRGVIFFLFALLLIRISGRRSFGLRTPLDNIIAMSLGAIISRAVVGASPVLQVAAASLVIVIMHRGFGWLIVRHPKLARLIEGDKIPLYRNGKIERQHLSRGLVSEEEMMQGVRKSAMTDNLDKVDKIYLERNGEISAVMKENERS
jgi:uncharacterized membrane protein YcaP (DUF421 family)